MLTTCAAGRIGRDASLKEIEGSQICEFPLAVDTGHESIWIDVSIFGQRGVKLCDYLKKGKQVTVSGKQSLRTGKNGKTYLKLSANDIALQGGVQQQPQEAPQTPTQAAYAAQAPADETPGGARTSDEVFADDLPF